MERYKDLYYKIDFNDRETVKALLLHRAEIIGSKFTSDGTMYNKISPTHSIYSDLIDIYIDLDNLISETDLTNKNKRLLNLVMSGYSINYIYRNFENYSQEPTIKMFNRTVEKINEAQKEKEGRGKWL